MEELLKMASELGLDKSKNWAYISKNEARLRAAIRKAAGVASAPVDAREGYTREELDKMGLEQLHALAHARGYSYRDIPTLAWQIRDLLCPVQLSQRSPEELREERDAAIEKLHRERDAEAEAE